MVLISIVIYTDGIFIAILSFKTLINFEMHGKSVNILDPLSVSAHNFRNQTGKLGKNWKTNFVWVDIQEVDFSN